jgi:hypothetical protein
MASSFETLRLRQSHYEALRSRTGRFVKRLLIITVAWLAWASAALLWMPVSLSDLALLGLWMLPMPLFVLQAWYHGGTSLVDGH